MHSLRELKEDLVGLKNDIHQTMDYLKLNQPNQEIQALEKKIQNQKIWQESPQEAVKIQARLNELKEKKQDWQQLLKTTDELFLLVKDMDDLTSDQGKKISQEERGLLEEVFREYQKTRQKYRELELKIYLNGKYDKRSALVLIYSGAGGIDAQNWAKMILRMYQRYAEKKGFRTSLEDINESEENGIKNAVLKISGNYAYGFLKNEAGVHRLIRISPYSSQSLRHTSFVLVEVLPEIEKIDLDKLKLKEEDLVIEAFKSSGPGGQNVNRRETAMRIIHKPSGLQASSQKERSQARNREEAMKLLLAKIIHVLEQKNLQKIDALKEKISPEWGNQIRTYVLHPYKQVRDHRSKVEISNVEAVLDGDLDYLIGTNLKLSS